MKMIIKIGYHIGSALAVSSGSLLHTKNPRLWHDVPTAAIVA